MVSNKSRLLRLYRYLYMYTDDKHYTTKAEIMETLKDDETVYSRQTVRNDIDTLAQEGYDIETVVSSGNYYYFRDREFTLDELRMIGDAVASSRFIGKKQKSVILGKLKQFCSKYQAQSVERHLVCVVPQESGDSLICDMVNTINDAINQGRKISFQLSEPGEGKPMLYPVKRIVKPVILGERAVERPEGFRSERFAMEMLSTPSTRREQ